MATENKDQDAAVYEEDTILLYCKEAKGYLYSWIERLIDMRMFLNRACVHGMLYNTCHRYLYLLALTPTRYQYIKRTRNNPLFQVCTVRNYTHAF